MSLDLLDIREDLEVMSEFADQMKELIDSNIEEVEIVDSLEEAISGSDKKEYVVRTDLSKEELENYYEAMNG